jgi:hypothetical protein
MVINDDGLQIIPEEERRARIEFYADNSIGWTARPKHNHNGFIRKGKFKKVCRLYLLMIQSVTLGLNLGIARCAIYIGILHVVVSYITPSTACKYLSGLSLAGA